MRRLGVTALALSVVSGLGGVAAAAAAADGTSYPSRHAVHQARHQAHQAAGDVAGIRAELVVADQRLQDAAITAERAAERFNGARWHLQQARRDARVAARHARIAAADVSRQRSSYAATVVSSYEAGPSLSSLSALTDSNGISTVVAKLMSLQNAQDAMNSKYDSYRASSTLAGVASEQAASARARAAALTAKARQARDAAVAAADAANRTTQDIAARKTRLIGRLANLQHISVSLAEQRQAGIEAAAQQAAQQAAEQQQQQQQQSQSPAPTQQPTSHPTSQPTSQPTQAPTAAPTQQPSTGPTSGPTVTVPPTSVPTPEPTEPTNPPSNPPTDNPPAPASGAQAAIAFAQAQIGDPYKWGATGPNAWDCSGLTMGAWQAGGISLPHYAAAQYTQSMPISAGQLQPGDLVFWGTNGKPSSIYHVALYIGNGQIIQAPRTGQDVQQVSMYYWIAPNFYARP